MNGIKVLVAEDDHLNRVMLCKLLEKLGAETDGAENGRDAVDKASANSYDIILLDYNMPGYSGAESAAIIREHYDKSGGKTPLLVCASADDDFSDRDVFDAFLPKPFKIEDIQGIIEKALEEA